jgi:threonine synthase
VPSGTWSPYLAGVSCFSCGRSHDPRALENVCRSCGLPLRVDYHLDRVRLAPGDLASRPPSLWRYREVLPLAAGEVTLTEGWTPLLEVQPGVHVKDEARNPTGSFKARGMTVAISAARAAGARSLSAPSAGNAASALAAYGAAAGLPVTVAMPEDTPRMFAEECRHYGAQVRLVPGTIADAGRWLREHGPRDAFDVSTLKEPYRLEGKKTMAYELYEQLGGRLPDVIVYPTGGGTGLVGMWKAFQEMAALGWKVPRPPRLVSVQPEGCAPVARAFQTGAETTAAWPDPHTAAFGLRVPSPIGGFLCLRALRETAGTAVVVSEAAIAAAAGALAARTGIDICPEGGAAWAATEQLRNEGWIQPGEQVVVFNTGTGLKYR